MANRFRHLPTSNRIVLIWMLLCLAACFGISGICLAWQPPQFRDAYFHEDTAIVSGNVKVDVSRINEGYMGISVVSDNRLKFQILKDDITYTYDIHSDGTPSILPFQSGNGEYTYRVMENVADTKYALLYMDTCQVTLDDEFQPFLRPNDYASYDADSACVAMAAQLAAPAETALEAVAGIFDYICSGITYDHDKAATVQSGYLPDPDETMATGKGICFDYASLAASMLRSQGIPAKVVFGYVAPDELYHAWNMFYTEETGWVTVDYQVSADDWNRLDITFAANGADSVFIGDGSNYSDLYYY